MITVYGTKIPRIEAKKTGCATIEEAVDLFQKKHPLYQIDCVEVDSTVKTYVGRCEVSNKVILEGDSYVSDEEGVKVLTEYCDKDWLIDVKMPFPTEDEITEQLADFETQLNAIQQQKAEYLQQHAIRYAPVSTGQKIRYQPTPHTDPGTVEILSVRCSYWPNQWSLGVRILDVPDMIGKTLNITISPEGQNWKPL